QPHFSKPRLRIDQSRLSLTSKRTLWRDTYLVKMEKRTGFIWTTLCPPFVSLATRERNAKKKQAAEYQPLYLLQSDQTHREYTIKHIKEETKGWTVGPYDFVGHGKIVQYGSSSFIGLCFWHPDMSAAQMVAMKAAWDARSRYQRGMRKLTIVQLVAEKSWRSKTKSTISKELGKFSARAPADYFAREILKRRKKERAEITQQISTLINDGNRKARKLGPRDLARVKNRSQIVSLSHKWAQLSLEDVDLMNQQ
ncbi:hypothetical protein B0H10DRAFT_2341549, partial [Mycena sp. CBHHK59/15]